MNRKASFGSYLVGLYLFSVPVFSYSGDLGLNKIPQIVGAFVLIYALYTLIRTPWIYRNNPIFLYFLFTIWSLTTYVFAEFQSQTESIFSLLKVAFISISVTILIKEQSDFICALSFFFISVFITFWLNYNEIMSFSQLTDITEEDRFAGTFSNANTASLYSLGIIWAGFILLFIRHIPAVFRFIIYTGIGIGYVIILYTGSNKGLLGIIFLTIIIAWILVRRYGSTRSGKAIIALLVIGGIYIILGIIFNSPFFFRVQTMFSGENDSAIKRVFIFLEAISVWTSSIKNLLVGVGLDNFRFYSLLNDYSHSTISESLACTGLVGFGLYFSSFLSIFSTYLSVFRKYMSDSRNIIILIFSFLILELFFNSAAVMYSDRLFWPLLGVISAFGVFINVNDKNIEVVVDRKGTLINHSSIKKF
jgi:hypothetical protein